jgi:hypothetical protein
MPETPKTPQEVREQVMSVQQAHTRMMMRLAKEIELLRKEVKTDVAALSRKIDGLIASFEE